jgi:hypothetical protein
MLAHDDSSEKNTVDERKMLKQIIEQIIINPDIINLEYLYELLEKEIFALCRQIEKVKNNPERLSILFNNSLFSVECLDTLKKKVLSRSFFFSGWDGAKIHKDYLEIEYKIIHICELIITNLYSFCTSKCQRLINNTIRSKIVILLFYYFETEIFSYCVNKMVVLKILDLEDVTNMNGVTYCLLCKKKYDHFLNPDYNPPSESKIYFCKHIKHSGKVLLCDSDLFNLIRYTWEEKKR